jgi:hypothetical protein
MSILMISYAIIMATASWASQIVSVTVVQDGVSTTRTVYPGQSVEIGGFHSAKGE